jgi:hypothetical protein
MRARSASPAWLVAGAWSITACSAQGDDSYEQFFNEFGAGLAAEYRLPRGDDLSYWGSDPNTVFYKSVDDDRTSKAPYWTKGDFNADGRTDRAYLLFSNTDSSVSLFAFLSERGGGYNIVLVEPQCDMTMGISTHNLASGDAVINLFRFEGEGVASYVWRDAQNAFDMLEEVWPPDQ